MYQDYEIALYTVKDLGDFVEIEYKGETTKAQKEIIEEMIVSLKHLGVGKIIRDHGGYPYLLLFPTDAIKTEL